MKEVLSKTGVHILLELSGGLAQRDVPHRHQEALRTEVVKVVHVVVHIGVQSLAALTFMDMVQHFRRILIHGAADVGSVVRLAVDRDQIVERIIPGIGVDQVVVLQESETMEDLALVRVVAHGLDGLDLLEDGKSVDAVLFFRTVLVDVELRHVHGQHQMRITVTDGTLVLHVDIVEDVIDDTGTGTTVGGADDPVENSVLRTTGVLYAIQVLDGSLKLLLEVGEAAGEGKARLHAERTGAELQRLVRNLGGQFIGASFQDTLVDHRRGVVLRLHVNGVRIALGKRDQVRLGIDERNHSVLKCFTVLLVVGIYVPLVCVEEEETILLIHRVQFGLGRRRFLRIVNLLLDDGDGVDTSTATTDENVFVILSHS